MSGTTTINAFRYPTLADAPNAQTAVQNLASDVDLRAVSVFSTIVGRDAAITSPTAGMLSYCADSGELYIRNGASKWVSNVPRIMVKSATESVTSSAALQNDDHLLFSVEANSSYIVNMSVGYDGATAGDLQFTFVGPAGITAGTAGGCLNSITTADVLTQGSFTFGATASVGCGGAGSTRTFNLSGMTFSTAATAGTVNFQWAQAVSNATATRLFQGCSLTVWKIA